MNLWNHLQDMFVNAMPMMGWLNVSRLNWLILFPGMVILLYFAYYRIDLRLGLAQSSISVGAPRWTLRRIISGIKAVVLCMALISLIVASAGPRVGWTWIESRQSGMDIAVAVDVSKSMMAQDLDPSRLEQAKRLIIDLLDVSVGDRIGLLVFAGSAFVQCPLTADHGAIRSFLDLLNTDMIPVGGTDIAGALQESLRALDAGGEEKGQGKIIILLTDGEDHKGAIDAAMSEVIKSKAKVITVGMASESGAPIPDPQGGFLKDKGGNVVVSRLTETPLKMIAEKSGGQYIRATDVGASVSKLYQDIIRQKGTVRETQAKKERLWYERFQWPAAAAFILLVLELFLFDVGLTTAGSLAVLLGILCVPTPLKASAADNDRYNQALETFFAGEAEKAKGEFEDLAKSASGDVQQRSLYNLGNIMGAAGQFDEAVKFYEAALALNSQDQQVRDNLEWAKKKSDAKKDKDKKDKKDKKDDKEDDKKDDKDKKPGDKSDDKKDDKDKKSDDKKDDKDKKPDDKKDDKDKKPDDKKDGKKDDGEKKSDDPAKNKAAEQTKQQPPMTPEEAEKLLRTATDDRKSFVPINRQGKSSPTAVKEDW